MSDTPRHGHPPIKMRRVVNYEKARRAGDFFWDVQEDSNRSINILVPSLSDPDGHMLARCGVGPDGWGWNGDSDRPTLKTSVLCQQSKRESWHGWVRNGFLVEA